VTLIHMYSTQHEYYDALNSRNINTFMASNAHNINTSNNVMIKLPSYANF